MSASQAYFSLFQIFKIGIGPSSSHTVGPMLAMRRFYQELNQAGHYASFDELKINLYGSLSLTGKGHLTDHAVMWGLMGYTPQDLDPNQAPQFIESLLKNQTLDYPDRPSISFNPQSQIVFHETFLPDHANAMIIMAYRQGLCLYQQTYFSVGGGEIQSILEYQDKEQAKQEIQQETQPTTKPQAKDSLAIAYPYSSSIQLAEHCQTHQISIQELVLQNEMALIQSAQGYSKQEARLHVKQNILNIAHTMLTSIERGLKTQGTLPGGLKVKRRAQKLYQDALESQICFKLMRLLGAYAVAVNEENADAKRVVTSPTNGSAGVIPALLRTAQEFYPDQDPDLIALNLLSTASAIGSLYKLNASISAAEMGCQGEIGVSSSMGAAGLCAVMGGTVQQILNAAEIAMEHSLGMTCDPIQGLVQIPCIERNSMGAIKALNAVLLSLSNPSGEQIVSLDVAIKTMHETGKAMVSQFKETSQGGLAVNYSVC